MLINIIKKNAVCYKHLILKYLFSFINNVHYFIRIHLEQHFFHILFIFEYEDVFLKQQEAL